MLISRSTKMRLLILVAGVFSFAGVTIKAAYDTFAANQSAIQAKLKRIIMEGGWEIPGLDQSKILYPRKLVEFYSEPKPVHLYITVFKPDKEVVASVPA